jgi:hypothetical protein
MDDFDKTVLRSMWELPYPLNYIHRDSPVLAYFLVKIGDKMHIDKKC